MKIVTWNMQGGVNAAYINQVIQQTGANVLCLQETGNMTNLLQAATHIVGFPGSLVGNFAAGPGFFECIYWQNAGWPQGGLAVMSNVGFVSRGITAAVPAAYIPPLPRDLPWMEVRDPTTQNPIRIYSIHSPPVWDGVTLQNVCAWNNAQVGNIAGGGGTWAIAGDFNADPTTPGFSLPPAGNVVYGPYATQQNAGILDYSITNSANYWFISTSQLVGASDHYPQEFSC